MKEWTRKRVSVFMVSLLLLFSITHGYGMAYGGECVADYNGDGVVNASDVQDNFNDIVQQSNNWYVKCWLPVYEGAQPGIEQCVPDYDGDGKTDGLDVNAKFRDINIESRKWLEECWKPQADEKIWNTSYWWVADWWNPDVWWHPEDWWNSDAWQAASWPRPANPGNWNAFMSALNNGWRHLAILESSLNQTVNHLKNWWTPSEWWHPEDLYNPAGWWVQLPYVSSADLILWGTRGGDTRYCIDLYDEDGNLVYESAACGENLHSFSPATISLPAGTYRWKVKSANGYGGAGFQGEFSTYLSTYEKIQWGKRNGDTFYCIDICDENGNVIEPFRAIACGENLLSWSPKHYINTVFGIPDPPAIHFKWKVWSKSGYGGPGYEGTVRLP